MKIKFIIPLFLIICSISCNHQKSNVTEVSPNNPISINAGETISLEKENLEITFSMISEDSRCPQDVQCVWSGVAVAQIFLTNTKNKTTQNITLSTLEMPGRKLVKSINYNGFLLTLRQVDPYPKTSGSIAAQDYKIILLVEKAKNPNTTTN